MPLSAVYSYDNRKQFLFKYYPSVTFGTGSMYTWSATPLPIDCTLKPAIIIFIM